MKKKAVYFITLFCVLASCLNAYGQKEEDTNKIYIRTFHEYFYVKALSASKSLDIKFSEANVSNGPQMVFEPNFGTYLGFGFFIFDLGFDVIFRTPPGPESNSLYGNTKARDWQMHAYGRKFGLDLSYQNYKGFYLSNPYLFYTDWEVGDPHPLQKDMRAQNISLSGIYVFKDGRFSFPSIFNQTEAQLRTAGSFFLSTTLNNSSINDPISIIPKVDSNNLGSLTNLTNVNTSSFAMLPGYSFNLVLWHKVYINLSLAIGPSYQVRSYTAEDQTYQNNSLELANTWRTGIGYNGRRFFVGLNGFVQNNSSTIQDLKIDSSIGFAKFFLGYRFREWGFMRKSAFDIFDIFKKKKNQ